MASIVIVRDSGYSDLIRSYEIVVDGIPVGEIWDGGVETISVEPGQHELQMRIDWCGSRVLHFDIAAQDTLIFSVRSNFRGLNLVLLLPCALLAPNRYLNLVQPSKLAENLRPYLNPKQFILRVGLSWGLFCAVGTLLWDMLYRDLSFEPREFFIRFIIWPIGGICFGILMWHIHGQNNAKRIRHALEERAKATSISP